MRIAPRPSISSIDRANSREGESASSISPFPEKSRTRCGAPAAGSAPTISSSSMPPTVYPCCFTQSTRCVLPSSPCSSPETAAKSIVARYVPRPPKVTPTLGPLACALLSSRAHSTLTATPDASSSAPGASASGSITFDGRESKCPETMNMVFASFASLPGRIAYTFSSGMGFPEVRSEVDSNLSTTTCNLPPESFAISLNRAAITSRPHPIPRFASVHEESVSRVPQATSLAISARIDFSSTDARRTLPVGRGKIFGCGRAFAGSAGSRGAARCAKKGVPISPSTTNQLANIFKTKLQVLPDSVLMRFPPANRGPNSPGILARLAIRFATPLFLRLGGLDLLPPWQDFMLSLKLTSLLILWNHQMRSHNYRLH